MIATGALAITAASLAAALVAQGPHAAHKSRSLASRTAATSAAKRAPTRPKAEKPEKAEKSDDAGGAASAASDTTASETEGGNKPEGKAAKTRTYTFGAMDVEGKMKTPQLLYFLNRVKLELEMSAPDKKSFMKELERSADDSSL